MGKKRTDNGLRLDYTLNTTEERKQYVDRLVNDWNDKGLRLREEDLELLSNYILYGKDEDGKSSVQRHEIIGESATFNTSKVESIEGLMELPGFQESSFSSTPIRYKVEKPNFDRKKIEKEGLASVFTPLWTQIDQVNERIERHKSGEAPMAPTNYYKMRHLLVELRREQYTLKDFYKPVLYSHPVPSIYRGGETDSSKIGYLDKYTVLPLGTYHPQNKIFLNPSNPQTPQIEVEETEFSFDFRKESHVYELINLYEDLETAAQNDPESVIKQLLDTLDWYEEKAKLSKSQNYIYGAKKAHQSNEESARQLKIKFGLNYQPSYVSTVYTHQICPAIAREAVRHLEVYTKRKEEGLWKICNTCGQRLPANPTYFVRQARAHDGLTNRCKDCDKRDRQQKKLLYGVKKKL